MKILNLGSGKIKPILKQPVSEPYFLINLDTSYYSYTPVESIEWVLYKWNKIEEKQNVEYFCNEDAFTFMERSKEKFDRICLYRFLEHIPMEKVVYFIYLLSTITKRGDIIDVIVPNYKLLAKMILDEDPIIKDRSHFDSHNILLTTELLNEPSCPHASIWTPLRAKYFFSLEKRFKISGLKDNYMFDGRNIYFRFLATRL